MRAKAASGLPSVIRRAMRSGAEACKERGMSGYAYWCHRMAKSA